MKRWLIEKPILLGCSNPTTNQLKELYQEGFKSIISLLDENEQSPNYDIEKVLIMGFKRYSIPLKDFSAPTLDKFQVFLKTVHQALGQGKVLVHCERGSGRTGTMAAAYWINKGFSAKKAIKKIRQSNPDAILTSSRKISISKRGKMNGNYGSSNRFPLDISFF